MQFKYIVATIASTVAFNGVTALPTAEAIEDVSLIEARAEATNQMQAKISAIEAAAVSLQEARVNFQAAKLEAAKTLIANGEKAQQAGHVQMSPDELQSAKDIVARAEQANQAQAAQAGEQGKQVAQGAQKAACWPYGCGGLVYGGGAYAGAGVSLGLGGLLNLNVGAVAGAGFYGGYGVW